MKKKRTKRGAIRSTTRIEAKKPPVWAILRGLIRNYTDAAVAKSWAGGGDPADRETLDLEHKLAWARLMSHIEKMERESQ